MSIEHAREGIEHAHHAGPDPFSQRIAILIAVLAAVLALCEVGERSAQNAYLTHHISVSDQWTFYGFKSTRARIVEQTATILSLQPGTQGNPSVQAVIEDARQVARRMRDGEPNDPGTRQIEEQARRETALRDEAFHRYERFELITSALQIAIVLASVAVVTRVWTMAVLGGVLGTVAGIAALLVVAGKL